MMETNTLWNKIQAFMHTYREILSYLIVGGLTTIVSLGSYYICIYTILDPANPLLLQLANIISWILAVTFAYFTNRKYVFLSKEKNIAKEMVSFYAGRVSTLLLDMGFMALFVSVMGLNPAITKLAAQVLITIVNYIISKKFVFKNHSAQTV